MKTKKTKKMGAISFFLSLVLLIAMTPITAFAEGTKDTWDGTADISWYNSVDLNFYITTAEQLAGFALLVNGGNTFVGKTICLDNDLDLSGNEWISIGDGNNDARYFGGTFDGQRHSIYNLTSKNSSNYYHGLFGVVSRGSIQNTGIIDANIIAKDTSIRAGILADWVNDGSVSGCYTTGRIESNNGDKLLGGLVGQCTSGTCVTESYSEADVISKIPNTLNPSCDTVGGLIGQWESANSKALISDCFFGGTISCEYSDAGVGGILGANFDFYDSDPGVTIRNCVTYTTRITCAEPDNITWIGAVVNSSVRNCFWPVDHSLSKQYNAVVKLVVDFAAGTANPDPTFDQSVCGKPMDSFTTKEFLTELSGNSQVDWVEGIHYPVFNWDDSNISADYSAVEVAKGKVPSDLHLYTNATVNALNNALNVVIAGMSKLEQASVDEYASAIEEAISALKYKGADYSKVNQAIVEANTLNKDNYKNFSLVEEAINAVVRGQNITKQAEVDAMAKAIIDAIASLELKPAKPSTESEKPNLPTTSDNSNMVLWIAILVVSCGMLTTSIAAKKRKKI